MQRAKKRTPEKSSSMQKLEDQDQGQERNVPQGRQNGNNGRNYAPMPFIQPMILICCLKSLLYRLRLFSLLYDDHPYKKINFKLKTITLQMLQNIQFHGLASENPNTHMTNFIEVCDMVKYNGVKEEALRLRLFPLSLGDKAKHWLMS